MSKENEKLHLIIKGIIPSKKNSKKILGWGKQARLITDPKIQQWTKTVQNSLIGLPKISGPIKMEIIIYNPDYRKRDLDNQLCTINYTIKDILIDEDDGKILQDIHIKWGGIDKENPRAEISISSI